ncbi:MAG: T9SS type A sorting domain-containing protein [Bacteroidia bacterium]
MKTKLQFSMGVQYVLLSFLLSAALSTTLKSQNLSITIVDSVQTACTDDAYATISVAGGVEPYTAYWISYNQSPPGGPSGPDTVAIGLSATGLTAGYYNIVVYDSSVPQAIQGYSSIFIQPAFQVNSFATPATCSNADGVLRITIANADGPFDIEWSNGEIRTGLINPSDSITNVASGNYSLRVTNNATGCFVNGGGAGTTGQGLFVWATSPVTATTSATPSNCFDGTATVTPANGTEPYTYLWDTEPAQTTQSATGLAPGFVYCTITDAAGCSRQQFVNVPAGPNYIQVTSTVTPSECGAPDGSINVTVTGGVAPYSYNWSNGESVEDISGLTPGSYQLQITDGQGCEIQVYKYVQTSSPVNVNVTGNYTGCDPNGGAASANVTGGQAPYTYQWSNGQTDADATGLTTGYSSVFIQDVNGCTGHDYVNLQLDASCYVHITGRVFNDLNGNCIQDANESGLPNVLVNASLGYHYATTNSLGNYHITALAGQYDIVAFSPENWSQICPDSPQIISVNAMNSGSTYGGNNFYLQPDSIFNDISVYVASGPVRPGFPVHWYATVRNLGTTTLSPQLQLEHDPLATYSGANPAVTSYSGATSTASWQMFPLQPLTSRNYYLYSTLSTSAVLGDSVRALATVTLGPAASDINPDNNMDYYARLITGSYDPNDKIVEPRGLGDEGYILYDDTTFYYRIRFQNTGTDTAFTVVVRDTLDASLDVPSFRLDQTSHPMEYEISGEGEIAFTFNNILLPDSFINEPASHGLVSYYINRKPNLSFGTQIRNTAAIYFDFNLPIYTNTTLNTLFDPTVSIEEKPTMSFDLLPNPAISGSVVSLNLQDQSNISYEVRDISGRLILHKNLGKLSGGNHQWGLSGLTAGIYNVTIIKGNSLISKRLIIN